MVKRRTKSSIDRISEERDPSPMLPVVETPVLGRSLADDSSPRRAPHTNVSRATSTEGQSKAILQMNKKVTFRFTNACTFRRSSKSRSKGREDSNASLSPRSNILSPVDQSPVPPETFSHIYTPLTRDPLTPISPSIWVAPLLTPAARSPSPSTSESDTGASSDTAEGAQLDMTSLAMNIDFETPMEDSENESEPEKENKNEREEKYDSFFA